MGAGGGGPVAVMGRGMALLGGVVWRHWKSEGEMDGRDRRHVEGTAEGNKDAIPFIFKLLKPRITLAHLEYQCQALETFPHTLAQHMIPPRQIIHSLIHHRSSKTLQTVPYQTC